MSKRLTLSEADALQRRVTGKGLSGFPDSFKKMVKESVLVDGVGFVKRKEIKAMLIPKKLSKKVVATNGKCLLPKQSEHELQCECFAWFNSTYPQYAMRLFAIPNSGHRYIAVAAKMKKEGQLAGCWDCFLSITKHTEDGFYGGLFLEQKVGKNTLTENQAKFYNANKFDYQFQVAHNLDEFKYHIINYLANG